MKKEFLVGILMVCGVSWAGNSPVAPPEVIAQPFDYMAALRKAEAAVADAGDDAAKRRRAMEPLAIELSRVGDTERAIESFRESPVTRLTRSPLGKTGSDVDAFLATHEIRDALAAIVEQARDRQIIMINEAHHVPRDRAFATLVALELRKLGFEYLAMEAVGDGAAISKRGYPTPNGYYTREPVLGDFTRQAARAGYVIVGYDFSGNGSDEREEGQAQNLIDRIFANNPKARVLVHAGYLHLTKGPYDSGDGKPRALMAERLRAKTGIDPFCIDQTQDPANAVADAIFARAKFDSFVLKARDAANPYSESTSVDMYVYTKPVRLVQGRPHWLAMDGYRKPRKIPTKLLPTTGRRLVQAFVEGESVDAVPMDQVLVTAGEKPPVFMLPKGKYRYSYQD